MLAIYKSMGATMWSKNYPCAAITEGDNIVQSLEKVRENQFFQSLFFL